MNVPATKMRIGEVHSLLRHDFPDIELSKIRYYEDKGLVRPDRSRKGYRLYSERDVVCLREAIRLAQEEFVPLRVVRLRLIEQGLLEEESNAVRREAARAIAGPVVATAPAAPSRARMSVVPDAEDRDAHGLADERRYSTGEFLELTLLEPDVVNQQVALGLLSPGGGSGAAQFSSLDVRVGLAVLPLVEREADLRLLGALRRVVEREMGVVEDLTLSLRQAPSNLSPEEVRTVTSEVAAEVSVLRSVLHERAVRAISE